MHRRRFMQTATITAITAPLIPLATNAHQPSPPDNEVNELAARVSQIDPESMLEALLTTPVTTPLIPSDTAPVEPVAWDDTSDSDLVGTVGGVVFNTDYDDNDNFLAIGNAIVHPNAESAVAAGGIPESTTFLGLPWITFAESDYAVSAVQIDYLILVGGAEATSEDVIANGSEAGEAAGATPASESGASSLTMRAIIHMTALLDHLETVLAGLDA